MRVPQRRWPRWLGLIFALALLLPGLPPSPPVAQAVSTSIVISQIYGGAGCGTAGCSTYKNDYIELFNPTASSVSVISWSVQYAAFGGTSWQVTPFTATIPSGAYFLIAESF